MNWDVMPNVLCEKSVCMRNTFGVILINETYFCEMDEMEIFFFYENGVTKLNHIRHFIKIPFINKGMDFIDLPSIFRDKSVQSSIPNYFKDLLPFW